MRYGMPYQGSKNQIAENILSYLPRGKRLVDLFGGGWEEDKRVLSGNYNGLTKRECIYTNREPKKMSLYAEQLYLFSLKIKIKFKK